MTSLLKLQTSKAFSSEIGRLFVALKGSAERMGKETIEAAETARQIGFYFQEWSGHEQVSFDFYTSHQAQLPEGMTLEHAKKFVSVFRNHPEPITELREAASVLQTTFETAGLLEMPKRLEPQRANPTTPLVVFVNTLGSAKEKVQKIVQDQPIEKWSPDRLETVISETAWAAELNAKAREILGRR